MNKTDEKFGFYHYTQEDKKRMKIDRSTIFNSTVKMDNEERNRYIPHICIHIELRIHQ